MVKDSKRRLLFITVLAIILLSSCVYMSLIPNVHAAEITPTTKGLTIINQVVGVDLTRYNATSTLDVSGSYLNELPNENVRYTLSSNVSKIDIQDTFTNGNLQMIDVLENSGSPYITTSTANVTAMARAFLLNYQGYSAKLLYGLLASTLNQADSTVNSTTIVGNVKFVITTISENSSLGNSTTFTWSYTANGVDAAYKCVSLSYKNGFLKDFVDTWNLYPIGSTNVSISKQEAEDIAMQNAKTYSWTIGSDNKTYVINNFNVTKPMVEQLVFCKVGNAANARSSDPLTLYPMWRIGVGLDKYYPGNVYGIYVDVWADTGQVRDIQEAFSTLPPPADAGVATIAESSVNNQTSVAEIGSNISPVIWIMFAALTVFTMLSVPVWVSKKKTSRSFRLPKLRKIGGAVLCLLIGSTALVVLVSAIPTVNAGCANIWGDNSDGSGGTLIHTSEEIHAQEMIARNITSWFYSCGYANYNMQGIGTTPSNVLTYTTWADQYYSPVATVWFDHGIGMQNHQSQPYYNQIQGYPDEFHFMLAGSTAVNNDPSGDVFDYQIYSATSTGNNYFSFISACMSAALSATWPNGTKLFDNETGTYGPNTSGSGYPIGMPYAWTHELTTASPTSNPPAGYMSRDGYYLSDSGPYCYIGVPWGSASLSQPYVDPSYPTTTYYDFVYAFFYYALCMQESVNQALDSAAYMCFTPDCFGATALYSGFTADWPQIGTMSGCTMVVYGNGNIYLYPGGPDYVSVPSVSGPSSGVANTSYQFNASSTDPCGHSIQYTFDWGDGSADTVTDWTASGQPVQVSHTWNSAGIYNVMVTAQSDSGLTSSLSKTVTIGTWLTVNAYDAYIGYGAPLNPNVYVDGTLVGTAPLSIQVSAGYHTVAVDDPTWDPYWSYYMPLLYMYDQNGNLYNGESILINSDTIVTAEYFIS